MNCTLGYVVGRHWIARDIRSSILIAMKSDPITIYSKLRVLISLATCSMWTVTFYNGIGNPHCPSLVLVTQIKILTDIIIRCCRHCFQFLASTMEHDVPCFTQQQTLCFYHGRLWEERLITRTTGDAEIAGLDSAGVQDWIQTDGVVQEWTLQDWTLSDRFGRGGHCRTGH